MKFKRIVLATDVRLNVSGEEMFFDIHRNEDGNLEIVSQEWDEEKYPDGMFYNMLGDELTLSTQAQ